MGAANEPSRFANGPSPYTLNMRFHLNASWVTLVVTHLLDYDGC